METSIRRPLGALSLYYFIISSTLTLPYHPWSQWTKVIFTERTCWEIKSSVNHEKIKILWRGLSASGNVEVVPIKKGRSLRKHQQTEAWGPGGVGEHGDWLGWAQTTVGASSLMKATVDKRGQTALWHFYFMDYERPSLRWRLHPPSRVMFVALSGRFSCMSHFLLLNVWIVHTTIAHWAAPRWCHAASLQPPHLTLETQAVVTEPSGSWFITCSPAFWSGSTPHWASTCYFHQQSHYSCSQLDYFTQQRPVLSLSVAAFGSAVRCWKDKLNIIVYWISGSINWAVLREKPENMFQPLDRDRWLSSACPVSWGHTARGQAPVEV